MSKFLPTRPLVPTHPVDEIPPPGRLALFGLQHVMVMYASAVAVPLIIGGALGMSPEDVAYLVSIDLFLCGVGTVLQTLGVWKVGARLPLVMGAAFNGVAPMVLIGTQSGIPTMYGSLIAGGVAMIVIAPLFTRVLQFFPPIVIGTAITLIGLVLMPAGVRLITGPDPTAPDYASAGRLTLGLSSLALVILLTRFLPGILRQLAILAALVLATIVSASVGWASFADVGKGAVAELPQPFRFGAPEFDIVAILSIVIIMLVLMVECTGQLMAVGEAVDREVDAKDVASALRADGVTTLLGGVFNSVVYTTFAQNIGIISITKIKSRYVVMVAGVMLMMMGLFPPIGRVVAAIPQPVLGGAALIMFASVTVMGLRILSQVDFDSAGNVVLVAASLGVGLIPVVAPEFYRILPDGAQLFLDSGVAAGTAVAVVLNILFNGVRRADTSVLASH